MTDSRKIMVEELKQYQGRHRQFYKIQFDKLKLDKFEPSKVISSEKKEIEEYKKKIDETKNMH